MIYLSGHYRENVPGIGFLMTPNSETRIRPHLVWAADNGRFSAPDSYTDDRYLSWLGAADPVNCLFATAPDALADHAETVRLSLPLMPKLRAIGYKAAFIAQDGFIDPPWDEFDALFIGGSTALGESVPGIVSEAKERGKWVHMGRVNSFKRMRVAKAIGCDSVDGTFLAFGPDINTARLLSWIQRLHTQPMLEFLP